MAQLIPMLNQEFLDDDGAPLVGGELWSYLAGTTTPQATYTDASEVTPNTNPIILDGNGRCTVWLGANAYKFVLQDSDGVTLQTWDQVSVINPGSVTTAKLADGSVTTAKLADGAATNSKLGDNSVTSGKLYPGAVITAALADLNVTTAKLADASVTTDKIADAAVTTAKIADGDVPDSKLNPLARTVGSICQGYSFTALSAAPLSPTAVPNLLANLTTSGRRVRVWLEPGTFQLDNIPNTAWKLWSITSTVTDATSAVQAGTATTILPTTTSQGCIIQAKSLFSQVTLTISQASASGTYTYQYWNGTAWTTLSLGTSPSFTATGTTFFNFTPPTAWVLGAGSSGADETQYSIRILSSVAPATAVQVTAVVPYIAQLAYFGSLNHGMTGNSTTAGSQTASIQSYFFIERSTSPIFPSNPTIIGMTSFFFQAQAYNSQACATIIPISDISIIDDGAGGGLAAGTYDYRVRMYSVYAGASGSGVTLISFVKLRAEEIR